MGGEPKVVGTGRKTMKLKKINLRDVSGLNVIEQAVRKKPGLKISKTEGNIVEVVRQKWHTKTKNKPVDGKGVGWKISSYVKGNWRTCAPKRILVV